MPLLDEILKWIEIDWAVKQNITQRRNVCQLAWNYWPSAEATNSLFILVNVPLQHLSRPHGLVINSDNASSPVGWLCQNCEK